MITLSFDDVSLTMSANDWNQFRNFMTWVVETAPIECISEYQNLLDQLGMGFCTHTRLYKEKMANELG